MAHWWESLALDTAGSGVWGVLKIVPAFRWVELDSSVSCCRILGVLGLLFEPADGQGLEPRGSWGWCLLTGQWSWVPGSLAAGLWGYWSSACTLVCVVRSCALWWIRLCARAAVSSAQEDLRQRAC